MGLISFKRSRHSSHPFLSLCCLEFTKRTVMFWSMKSNTVLMRAGKKAAQRAHTGRVMKGTSHGRPTVVVSAVGTVSVGRARAYLYGVGGGGVKRQRRSKKAKGNSRDRSHMPARTPYRIKIYTSVQLLRRASNFQSCHTLCSINIFSTTQDPGVCST